MMPLEAYVENFYVRTRYNFGFNGDLVGLPVEVSLLLFEHFLFFEDTESEHFISMVIHMIRLKLDHILSLAPDILFKYVSNGHFITDCLMNESSFDQIFLESILVDFDD